MEKLLAGIKPKQTAQIIGRLCFDAHPEAENEVEAVDIHASELYKMIQLKMSADIKTADDIELYFTLCSARSELLGECYTEFIHTGKP